MAQLSVVDKIKVFCSLLKIRFGNIRRPLAVRWQVTNRCPHTCPYCNVWNHPTEDLSLDLIKNGLRQLKDLGVMRISFSGGEPLMREDIGDIVQYSHSIGIVPEMNSSGVRIEQHIKSLNALSLLKLSLDGPKEIHDSLRSKGSHDAVLRAADLARENNIRFSFATTITKYNVEHLAYLLGLAKKYETFVAFQPLTKLYECGGDMQALYPPIDQYKKAIQMLIQEKKKKPFYLRNSMRGLQDIYDWPNLKKIKCWAGKAFFMINADGQITPCDRVHISQSLPNFNESSLSDALSLLPEVQCSGCGFCGTQELNYLLSFDQQIVKTIQKVTGNIHQK